MRVLGIIPARYASSRFPGKALVQIQGKTMIRRVYEQAIKSQLVDKVLVATDDQRIFEEVSSFGGAVMMTSAAHRNGTERCAEVILEHPGYDYVINIQGDEPFIHPEHIDRVASLLDGDTELATLVKKITDPAVLDDPSEMKVIFNQDREAIYFSRACIPYLRDVKPEDRLKKHTFYKHIGLYGYRRDILLEITQLPPGTLETAEALEQLRWIENGYSIKIGLTTLESQMIDTPEDLAKLTQDMTL
ncbi:3-deoxy-manno-octulosonate cytidylyltransferase [Marinoscillum luteum]|uniref:3-deoxy-manno-octulosonate cytidylyltransferase n=1 Tax=Marinoscillum luteum TaxID=861051 RepID=A0ABW7N5K7_9BACT